jgi:hypothetical protein
LDTLVRNGTENVLSGSSQGIEKLSSVDVKEFGLDHLFVDMRDAWQ